MVGKTIDFCMVERRLSMWSHLGIAWTEWSIRSSFSSIRNETINNQLGYNVGADAIGQLRVISANANAEFGNVGGGDVITLLKSGTNSYHGSAYMYLSNYNMDANTYANKHFASSSSFVPKTPYTYSLFGGTFGGRIIKDKLFFFVD